MFKVIFHIYMFSQFLGYARYGRGHVIVNSLGPIGFRRCTKQPASYLIVHPILYLILICVAALASPECARKYQGKDKRLERENYRNPKF